MSLKKNILKALAKAPKTEKQLKAATGAEGKRLAKELKLLVKEKKIQLVKGGYVLRGAQNGTQGGKIEGGIPARIVKVGHSFGFAAPLDEGDDIFIPGHALQGAMPGDQVMVKLYERPRVPGSREGEVTSLLAEQEIIVGTVHRRDGKLVLVPDNSPETPLTIKKNMEDGAKEGEKAAVQFEHRGLHHADHRMVVTLRFGSADSAMENARAILYGAGIPTRFPSEVVKETKSIAAGPITKQQIKQRKDLRGEAIFTIDAASTKDIDDAISAKKTAAGYRLGVHIADVSHYVQPKSKLDNEAMQRGTSVYYADSVVPMLPKALSNGICSLNPGEDRLAFSCLLQLDDDARIKSFKFVKSVIHSRVKGVYTEVNALLAQNAAEDVTQKYTEVLESLAVMREIYQKLAALRTARGSMEIESDEAKIVVDDKGRCVDVQRRSRGEAERMIEEFMLLANTAAAQKAKEMDIPFVYRTHDKPPTEKVEKLKSVLASVGVHFAPKSLSPTQTELAALLNTTRGTPLERFVHPTVLRTMAKAKYEAHPAGHYGLALADYAHFTSPIRRYPDLAIHRILTDVVENMPKKELRKRYAVFAQQAAAVSSERELVAQRAERDCDDCYKAEYMRQFIGEEYEAVVASVMQFGIYVELANTVQGLIHISRLSADHMELTEGVSLQDPLTGKSYRIGDVLRVKVVGADVSQGHVDFDLA